jgi:hypothetical protein
VSGEKNVWGKLGRTRARWGLCSDFREMGYGADEGGLGRTRGEVR